MSDHRIDDHLLPTPEQDAEMWRIVLEDYASVLRAIDRGEPIPPPPPVTIIRRSEEPTT